MLGLPTTTPTPAVIFATGMLYATIRVEMKQLLYLHQLLQKENEHWAQVALNLMDRNNAGWAKVIRTTLEAWALEERWELIAKKTKLEWKREVEDAAERVNREMLKNDCLTKERGETKPKSKTKTIIDELEKTNYRRKPLDAFQQGSVVVARACIMGRYGMLKCKDNFSYGSKLRECDTCRVKDDEDHRINGCILYRTINLYDSNEKINFSDIYSEKTDEVSKVVDIILRLWDLGTGRNEMRNP